MKKTLFVLLTLMAGFSFNTVKAASMPAVQSLTDTYVNVQVSTGEYFTVTFYATNEWGEFTGDSYEFSFNPYTYTSVSVPAGRYHIAISSWSYFSNNVTATIEGRSLPFYYNNTYSVPRFIYDVDLSYQGYVSMNFAYSW
ncbi:hypothetical protein [uncultured Chitinophaga sp.]|uniref:hypothetical protein n=1 Tax=uncultured Chitinophaga sp. TaxID=339340 RepID=UPI0025FF1AE3|nr:hypothetical protein [uncultured Chitinophaga sp.]